MDSHNNHLRGMNKKKKKKEREAKQKREKNQSGNNREATEIEGNGGNGMFSEQNMDTGNQENQVVHTQNDVDPSCPHPIANIGKGKDTTSDNDTSQDQALARNIRQYWTSEHSETIQAEGEQHTVETSHQQFASPGLEILDGKQREDVPETLREASSQCDRKTSVKAIGSSTSTSLDSTQRIEADEVRSTGVDSFVDAVEQLAESRASNVEELSFLNENNTREKELSLELSICKDALAKAIEEKEAIASKLKSALGEDTEELNMLKQKLEGFEAEISLVLSKIKETEKFFKVKFVDDSFQSKQLDVVIERFIDLVRDMEVRHTETLENVTRNLQAQKDENLTLLKHIDEQKLTIAKAESEYQQLKSELAEMKLCSDKTCKTKDTILTEFDSYKQHVISTMVEKKDMDELQCQINQLTKELQEIGDNKIKVTNELDKFKSLSEKLEQENEKLVNDVQKLNNEIEQMMEKKDHMKNAQEHCEKLAEQNTKIMRELEDNNHQLLILQKEKAYRDRCLRDLADKLNSAVASVTSAYNFCNKNLMVNKAEESNGQSEAVDAMEGSPTVAELIRSVNATSTIFALIATMEGKMRTTSEKISVCHRQLKEIAMHQEIMHEGFFPMDGKPDQAESQDSEWNSHFDILFNECEKFIAQIREAFIERSKVEDNRRELELALHNKDQEMNEKLMDLSSKCSEYAIVTARCSDLEAKCDEMTLYLVQSEKERESLRMDIQFLQKSLAEVEISKNEAAAAYSNLKSQYGTMLEKFIASIRTLIPNEILFAEPDIERSCYLERSISLLVDRYKQNLSHMDLLLNFLLEAISGCGDLSAKEPQMTMDVVLRETLFQKQRDLQKLQKAFETLDSVMIQEKKEGHSLNDQLCKCKEDLHKVNEEKKKLQTELEEMETRYSTCRDKLRLAISKGKSFESKYKELETCMQELEIRNKALADSEMYSTERIKKLEQELTKSQRSSSILQESLSEKDVLLHRICKILWEADLLEIPPTEEIIAKVQHVSKSLEQALKDREYLKSEVESAKKLSDLLTTELEELRKRTTALEQQLIECDKEKVSYSRSLEELNSKLHSLSEEATKSASQISLSEELLRRLSGMVGKTIEDQDVLDDSFYHKRENFEECLQKLMDNLQANGEDLERLRNSYGEQNDKLNNLQDALTLKNMELNELSQKHAEHDSLDLSYRAEIEALKEQIDKLKGEKDKLVGQLEESKEKEKNLRDKCVKAVKRGKGFAQECENLKQSMDEKITELDRIKAELQSNNSLVKDQEQMLSSRLNHIDELEREELSLKQKCSKLQQTLLENENSMQNLLTALDSINIEGEISFQDPIQKIQYIGRLFTELQQKVVLLVQKEMKIKGEVDELQQKVLISEQKEMELRAELLRRLSHLVGKALEGQDVSDNRFCDNKENFEESLRRLLDNIQANSEELEVLKKAYVKQNEELNHLQDALTSSKAQLNELSQKQAESHAVNLSYRTEVEDLKQQNTLTTEELDKLKAKNDDLLKQLEESKDKEKNLKDKCVKAVKKGKGFAQECENLKQCMDEKAAELERIKMELQVSNSLAKCQEGKIKMLSSNLEHISNLERDELSLKDKCSELQTLLLESKNAMQNLIAALDSIDFPKEIALQDPVHKIQWMSTLVIKLQENAMLSEQEMMNAKGEVDMLKAKLNQANECCHHLENELSEKEREILALKFAEEGRLHEVDNLSSLLVLRTNELKESNLRINNYISGMLKQFSKVKALRKEHYHFLVSIEHDYQKKVDWFKNIHLSLRNAFSHLKMSANLNSLAECAEWTPNAKLPEDFASGAGVETGPDLHLDDVNESKGHDHGNLGDEISDHLNVALDAFSDVLNSARERLNEQSNAFDEYTRVLSEIFQKATGAILNIVESRDSLQLTVSNLESLNKEKDYKISIHEDGISLLIKACCTVTKEIKNLRPDITNSQEEETTKTLSCLSELKHLLLSQTVNSSTSDFTETCTHMIEEFISEIQEVVHETRNKLRNNKQEGKTLIEKLRQELDSRNYQESNEIKELKFQLAKVEAVAQDIIKERDSNKRKLLDLEKENRTLNLKLEQLQADLASAEELREELQILNDTIQTKEEVIKNVNKAMEKLKTDLHEKRKEFENLESSYKTVATELSNNIKKYNESQQLSERFITEAENLRFLVEIRDQEILSLKKEISSFNVPALLEEMDRKKHDLDNFLERLGRAVTILGTTGTSHEGTDIERMNAILNVLERGIPNIVAELESSKADSIKQGFLLQNNQHLVQELSRKVEVLESSQHPKQSVFASLQSEKCDSLSTADSEASEIEELGQPNSNLVSSLTIAPHARGIRKVPSEHLALAINKSTSEVEDNDKGRAFKPLTTTGLIPVSVRSVADRADGLCVSAGRILMREPKARIGVIVYWILLHFWLVATIF